MLRLFRFGWQHQQNTDTQLASGIVKVVGDSVGINFTPDPSWGYSLFVSKGNLKVYNEDIFSQIFAESTNGIAILGAKGAGNGYQYSALDLVSGNGKKWSLWHRQDSEHYFSITQFDGTNWYNRLWIDPNGYFGFNTMPDSSYHYNFYGRVKFSHDSWWSALFESTTSILEATFQGKNSTYGSVSLNLKDSESGYYWSLQHREDYSFRIQQYNGSSWIKRFVIDFDGNIIFNSQSSGGYKFYANCTGGQVLFQRDDSDYFYFIIRSTVSTSELVVRGAEASVLYLDSHPNKIGWQLRHRNDSNHYLDFMYYDGSNYISRLKISPEGNVGIGIEPLSYAQLSILNSLYVINYSGSGSLNVEGVGDGYNYSYINLRGAGKYWNISHRANPTNYFELMYYNGSTFLPRLLLSPEGYLTLYRDSNVLSMQVDSTRAYFEGELRIKIYSQTTEPTLTADESIAIWKNTGDSNRIYLVFRRGSGDQVKVELT